MGFKLQKRFSEGVPRRGFQKMPRTPPRRVRPMRRAPYFLSLVFGSPWCILISEFLWLFWCFLCIFQGYCGDFVGSAGREVLSNFEVVLDKKKTQTSKRRAGFNIGRRRVGVFQTRAFRIIAFKHLYKVKCRNRLHVRVRAETASVSALACCPSKAKIQSKPRTLHLLRTPARLQNVFKMESPNWSRLKPFY